MIKNICNGAIINIRTAGDNTVSSYNRFTPSIYSKSLPFALIMDELTKHIKDNIPQCKLFADDNWSGWN